MDTKEYREADRVVLLDEKIMLNRMDYSDAVIGWNEFGRMSEIGISGEGLDFIFQASGIEQSSIKLNEKYRTKLNEIEIPFFYQDLKDPDNFKVIKIYANELDGILRLRLFIYYTCEEDNQEKIVFRYIDLSYSGKYTIWWALYSTKAMALDKKTFNMSDKHAWEQVQRFVDNLNK